MSEQARTELSHEEAVGLVDAWRDGELDEGEASRVEAHFESCERCQAVESAFGGGLRAVVTKGEADAVGEEKSLLPGVQRRIRLRSRGRFYGSEPARPGPSPWPLLIGSVAVLAALVVSYLMFGHVASNTPGTANTTTSSPSGPTSPLPR